MIENSVNATSKQNPSQLQEAVKSQEKLFEASISLELLLAIRVPKLHPMYFFGRGVSGVVFRATEVTMWNQC